MIMNLFLKYFLLLILLFFSLMSISITDLFILWIFMEITNFLYIAHLALLLNRKPPIFFYFLIQIISSFILIISLIMNNFCIPIYHFYLITLALMMKIGIPPLHFWMIIMSTYMTWNTLFLMLTIQKLIPLYFYSLLLNNDFIWMHTIILMCMMIPPFFSLNLLNYKKLLTYSSINQTGWMILLIHFKSLMWMIYFLFYSLLLLLIIFSMNSLNYFYHSSIHFFNMTPSLNLSLLLMMLNFSGMPPFSFFLLKWYSIFLFILNSNLIILFILMMFSTLFMMYIYINMMMNFMFIFISNSKLLNLHQLNQIYISILSFFSFFLLFLIFI